MKPSVNKTAGSRYHNFKSSDLFLGINSWLAVYEECEEDKVSYEEKYDCVLVHSSCL